MRCSSAVAENKEQSMIWALFGYVATANGSFPAVVQYQLAVLVACIESLSVGV